MNQILISEKLYVTPELKKKKKVFKWEFLVSIVALFVLIIYAICSEYDRNKSEQVSKEILENMEFTPMAQAKEKVMIVLLNEALDESEYIEETDEEIEETIATPTEQTYLANDGTEYSTIGIVNIPSINVYYPILSTTTTELLKIAPCKFWGPNPNEVGNLCIVGHNYKNAKFFSHVPELQNGDVIEITDLSGKTITYIVYDKYIVDPDDVGCTSQQTNGKKEITLITCTNDNAQRHVIKARAL